MIENLLTGISVSFAPINLLYCFVGVTIGTLVGVLPGLGPTAAISLLLPITFGVDPISAIILLSGIYYGAQYGGSITSILVNIPGEVASIVTCLDGYQMAQKGRAGPALGISAIGSFIGGTVGVIGLMLLAPPLASIALRFGPPEYFTLLLMGMALLVFLASGSIPKALTMAVFGVVLGGIGQDQIEGMPRFTFGVMEFLDGIGLVPVAMGLFGVSEVLLNVEKEFTGKFYEASIRNLLPNKKDWLDSARPILRGTFLGFLLGILPGGGAVISSFVSYSLEKRFSKYPEKFGTGVIEGVAGPETANNSATAGAFVPLLTLGIPSNVIMALLLGALMIHGITPSPLLVERHPELFWGVIVSMYIGNVMLLVLNLPLIGLWIKVLKIPYKILFPLILIFCLIGVYSLDSKIIDMYVMIGFGIFGYLAKKFDYEGAPMMLAFVIGPLLENSLRQSLLMSQGSFLIFVTRPLSAVNLVIASLLILSPFLPGIRRRRVTIAESVKE